MIIRPATPDDADGIAHVHVEGWRTAYKSLLPAEFLTGLSKESRTTSWQDILNELAANKITFVAEESGKVLGFVSCGPERTGDPVFCGEVYAIYLLEDFHHQGIGTALFRKGIDFLLDQGLNSMKVWVLKDNPHRTFYERHGGQAVEEKPITIGGKGLIESAYGWKSLKSVRHRITESTD